MWGSLAVGVFLVISSGYAQLRVGGALNLFGRYGYLPISMKVVPRNDTNDSWIFREPLVDVFKNLIVTTRVHEGSPPNTIFHGEFNMELCDDIPQLLQAYFRNFTVERLDRPWEAFSGAWNQGTVARYMGLNASYVSGPHGYVLVRLSRYREVARLNEKFLPSSAPLHEAVSHQADMVTVGNLPSVGRFVRSFGSHYIASYLTGNALYQVLVYHQSVYNKLKAKLQESDISSLSNSQSLFSPHYAEHIGLVLSASGNSTLNHWAKTSLRLRSYFSTYTSLLKLHGNTKLLKELDLLLGNEALLKLELRTLAPVFKDESKRHWFQEVIDNTLKLWEVNM